jgi:hypothetical protein
MIILHRRQTRPSIDVPFFGQMITDPGPWDVYPITTSLKTVMAWYEPRFSKDVLIRHSLWTFNSQYVYDAFTTDPEIVIRTAALHEYDPQRGIISEETVLTMTSQEFSNWKVGIVDETWPFDHFNITVIPGTGIDAFVGDDSTQKPKNDDWALHPWFLAL